MDWLADNDGNPSAFLYINSMHATPSGKTRVAKYLNCKVEQVLRIGLNYFLRKLHIRLQMNTFKPLIIFKCIQVPFKKISDVLLSLNENVMRNSSKFS